MPRMIRRGWATRWRHWDGDTLVIDTVGYNGKHSIGGIQQPSESFHTIERLTRINGKDIFYEIIYEDPEKATGPVASDAHVRRRHPRRREQGDGVRLREQPRLHAAVRTAGPAAAAPGRPGRRRRGHRRRGREVRAVPSDGAPI